MKIKNKIIIGASLASIAALGAGAFAFFSDKEEGNVNGAVGTVDVTLSDLALTHSGGLNNMNPGDNDPDNDDSTRKGNDHELAFTITNAGNKSIITRTRIEVTGTKGNTNISADELKNIILSEKPDATAGRGVSNTDVIESGFTRLQTSNKKDTNTLVYIVGGNNSRGMRDVLDGVGSNAEKETGNGKTSTKKAFDVGLDKDVTETSPLMGATINFKVIVEAMQYRNTSDNDWVVVFTQDASMTVNA